MLLGSGGLTLLGISWMKVPLLSVLVQDSWLVYSLLFGEYYFSYAEYLKHRILMCVGLLASQFCVSVDHKDALFPG